MQEKRSFERVNTDNLFCNELSGDYLFTYKVKDISLNGAFLESKILSEEDEVSSFKFTDQKTGAQIELRGKVVRESLGDSFGCGVQFVLDDDNKAQKLRGLLGTLGSGNA